MRKFDTVKHSLFTKLVVAALFLELSPYSTQVALAVDIAPHLECGIYEASGKLNQDNSSNFVLNLHGPKLYPYELLLVGNPVRELMEREGSFVKVRFYVPRKILHSPTPYVVLLKFLKRKSLLDEKPKPGMEPGFEEPRLVVAHRCGDRALGFKKKE
jgi:hypothetical protein